MLGNGPKYNEPTPIHNFKIVLASVADYDRQLIKRDREDTVVSKTTKTNEDK